MKIRPLGAVATSLFALTACTVGPDYVTPVANVPATFATASSESSDSARSAKEPGINSDPNEDLAEIHTWWHDLGDPKLAELVERAMVQNLDLEIALARIAEARAFRRAQGGRLLPSVRSSASGGRSKASAQGPGALAGLAEAGLASLENELFTAGFDASWELDLFGKIRRAKEASQARLEGAEESRRALMLIVASEVAATYIDWAGTNQRLLLAQRNLDLQQSTLDTIEVNVSAGLAAPLDQQRSRAQVETTRASLPPLRTQRAATEHRLAVLLGRPPGSLADELQESSEVPTPPTAVATGLPADLVWRRPDLRAAERERHAATADVGAAIGERFPSISLGGSRGFEAGRLSDLIESASRVWSFGPRIDLPIFNGGQLKAGVVAARARRQIAETNWQRAVLLALEDVETSLVAYEQAAEQVEALQAAATAGRKASQTAQILFDEGLSDFLTLLDAQRSQTLIDDGLSVARIAHAQRAVSLYRALGGGWKALDDLSTPPSAPGQPAGR